MTSRLPRLYFVALLAILIMMTAFPASVRAQDDTGVTATVSANIVSLQSGPGLEFSPVGTATLGQKFPVVGRARGSNRIWYQVTLPTGGTAWLSERIVNIDPSPDSLPWLGDNLAKTPLVMDCGKYRPILFVGAFAQVISKDGVVLYKEAGVGKREVGGAALNGYVQVLDGPFCTLLSTYRHQIQWLVVNQAGVSGYMLESLPNGKSPFVKTTSAVSGSDFPAVATSNATPDASGQTPVLNDRPASVTDADIQAVTDIFEAVQNKKITQKETEAQLNKFVTERGAVTLAWIIRHTPIYDGRVGGWYSFTRYQDQSLMKFNLSSDVDINPVKTAIGILFGKFKGPTEILTSMGCGG